MIVQRFNLNLIPNQSPVIVHVNQYDTGTGRLVATLYEGNEPYSPNGTAVIQGTKPDGHGFQYTATLDGNVVTADLNEQMSPVAGDVRTQIVVTESSGVTGTFVFIIRVQPSALPSDTDMSESDYQYIEEAIREAQEAVQTAQEATETAQEAVERAEAAITETRENAENSEAWAQGTRGGIPVEPTDPTYEHNAEYWAQYAERYAQGGLHYKASIPFVDIPTTGMREGDMYDITDDFTTDSRFTEGAGIEVKGGTNIAWNSDSKWDILALPYIPKTTFNGRSGSILPMAGDYDSKKILLTSALHIGGETQNDVQEALEALEGNKADKVDNAVADNFAGLDADGNLKDSGKKASDFATPSDIEQIYADNGVLGAKNLGRNKLQSLTSYGVTYTHNNDDSITLSGTETKGSDNNLPIDAPLTRFNGIGNVIFSFEISGFNKTAGEFAVGIYDGSNWINFTSITKNEIIEIPIDASSSIFGSNSYACIMSRKNFAGSMTIKYMVRFASDPDDTYQPYAMTNRELTDKVNAVETDFTNDIDALKSYFGILTTPVPSYVANTLPVLKRNITSAFYNGSLRGEIAAGSFKNVRPGDYIIGQATGSTYYVAMCDYRLGKGDQTNNANYPAYGTHHLGLMLFKPVGTTALWRGYGHSSRSWRVSAADLGRCPWNAALDADPANTEAVGADNTNITRTYGSANVSGYMGSFIRERIDAILLPQCFQADFGSANVLKYREINGNAVVTDKPSGGQGNWNGCTSGWGWYDRHLDLPSEVELYGSRIFGSGMDTGCQCEQLPLFRNAAIHDFYPRIDIWTKAVASSSVACRRDANGHASTNTASTAFWACPLACVK